jgi:GT2 family glycosyltransferase
MSEETETPKSKQPKSRRIKSDDERAAQMAAGKRKLAGSRTTGAINPIVVDETYGELREAERVVMRHQIALNIDSFRAAPEAFVARPVRSYAPLLPTASPFFSVIIPNYNGLNLLPTVLSALKQQHFGDLEIVVIDDASTDGSVAWLEEHYPEVRLIVNRHNEGFVAACNRAADAARGRVLIFLNSDTEPEPGWTAALAQAVCSSPDAGIFASKLLLFDKREVLHSAGDSLGLDGIPRNRGVWERDLGQYDAARAVFAGCGGAVAYRRELWALLGGFDESLWMYLEDVDFAFRAQLLGWDARFVPEARVYHRLSATSGGALSSYYVGRNTIWVIIKNMPRSLLFRNLPAIVLAQAKIALDALRHWRGAAARARLRGQLAALMQIRQPLAQRRLIQPRRVRDDRELAARLER